MANELELLERAKMYIDSMAKGINPVTGEYADEEDVINEVKVSRCLYYVSDVLEEMTKIKKKALIKRSDRVAFTLDIEQRSKFEIDPKGLSVSQIVDKLNSLTDELYVKKLKSTAITTWLVEIGMLEVVESTLGNSMKRPTSLGRENGIYTEERFGRDGRQYTGVFYSPEAQQFILDNLDAVIEVNQRPTEKKPRKEKMNWTMEKEQILIQLFQAGATIPEIAGQMNISENAVAGKIGELGLWSK